MMTKSQDAGICSTCPVRHRPRERVYLFAIKKESETLIVCASHIFRWNGVRTPPLYSRKRGENLPKVNRVS
jgi:hypothetical protein